MASEAELVRSCQGLWYKLVIVERQREAETDEKKEMVWETWEYCLLTELLYRLFRRPAPKYLFAFVSISC